MYLHDVLETISDLAVKPHLFFRAEQDRGALHKLFKCVTQTGTRSLLFMSVVGKRQSSDFFYVICGFYAD